MKSIELNKLEYSGDLGAKYSKESTKFTLWAPIANEVSIYLYEDEKNIPMVKGDKGQWEVVIDGDLKNKFYNYKVKINEKINTVVDPYAYAVGVNGEKSMVVDLESTNPKGWENDIKPEFKNATDAIIYEMHVRDFTIDESSEVEKELRGKFKGILHKKPISHLKELGVTHVQLLPISDYKSVDESKLDEPQYNWGYDPQNYNVPEGSYSTNPNDGNVRIKEFKELVKSLHEEGIRVVMDVVYNHTYDTETSLFNLAVPNYYYRTDEEGNFTNGSGCGNEVASEKPMIRRYIKDSVVNWAKEYHIDGFRFDLMGLHDIETIIQIREELDKLDKSILVYGEGWAGGATPLKEEEAALKLNAPKFGKKQIGCFSDDIRDGVKGDVFIAKSTGFVNGGENFEETIKFGIVASTQHSQVDYSKVIYSNKPWANEPYQTITYASAHDNYTLWDKLQLTVDDDSINKEEKLIKMNKLVASIVLTSQGISLIHAGEEILRTKVNEDGSLVENSYKSPDSVNKFDWNRKDKYKDVFNYYSGLIKLRKTYKEFRLTSNEDIEREVRFLENNQSKVVSFTISNKIVVIHNANEKDIIATIPEGNWSVLVDEYRAGVEELSCINGNEVKVPALASYVLVRK
ncbi:hypothetical protein UT300007_32790 [Clostridium sp. CTA-7]